jgi:monoamine oxidase
MRTPAFRALARTIAAGRSRRAFLKGAAATGLALPFTRPDSLFAQSSASVAIVGAGLAGLACADRLAARGIAATVYDAASRGGGRCFSLSGRFPGQVVERGGELIDNLHKVMIGYAKRYRLTLEDVEKQPGEVFYLFDGDHVPEATVVEEYRAFVAAMREDLRTLSPERIARRSDGRIELTFATGGTPVVTAFDHVVLTVPFTVLRQVTLDATLGLPSWKRNAIDLLGCGTNAKMMVGFDTPYWRALGSSGASYSDLAHHQTTWETSPTTARANRAVLTDYSSGTRGAGLNPLNVPGEADLFLGDLEQVFPGALAHVARDAGVVRAHLEHWPSNPLTRGPTPATSRDSSRQSPGWRGHAWRTCTLPASTRTRSTTSRVSWKARACPDSTQRTRSCVT